MTTSPDTYDELQSAARRSLTDRYAAQIEHERTEARAMLRRIGIDDSTFTDWQLLELADTVGRAARPRLDAYWQFLFIIEMKDGRQSLKGMRGKMNIPPDDPDFDIQAIAAFEDVLDGLPEYADRAGPPMIVSVSRLV